MWLLVFEFSLIFLLFWCFFGLFVCLSGFLFVVGVVVVWVFEGIGV